MQVPTHLTPPNRLQVRITVATVKTIKGKPIREDQIDAWVTEAENGYDIEFLRAGGRRPHDIKHGTKPKGSVTSEEPDPEGNEVCVGNPEA